MRILCLDPGEKRIGVAVSDALGITAQGLDNVAAESEDDALKTIAELCRRYDVCRVVVGNPLNMNGSAGPASKKAVAFASQLHERLSLPVDMIDERLSTAGAEKALLAGDVKRKKRRLLKDRLAAVLILEKYLATLK